MGRRRLIYCNLSPYHICARSNNRLWFGIRPRVCWEIFCDVLNDAVEEHGIEIQYFVLMSNHYHLIVRTPEANISKTMHFIQTNISRRINRQRGSINHVFGRRYSWSIIRCDLHYAIVAKYVVRNPVKAQIVDKVEQYPWSSIGDCREPGSLSLSLPSIEKQILGSLPVNFSERLSWFNIPFGNEREMAIASGLNKNEFGIDDSWLDPR